MIKKDSEPQIGNVKGRIQSILGLRVLELHPILDPNLQRNFAAVAAYTASGKQATTYLREWQKKLGRIILNYFALLADAFEA